MKRVLDAALVVVAAAGNIVGTLLVEVRHQPDARPLDVLGIVLLLLPAVALWWRRDHPALVLGGCFVVTAAFVALPYPDGPVYLPLIVGLVTAVMAGQRVVAYSVVTLAVLLSTVAYVSAWRTAALIAWLLFLVAVGELVRYRRALAVAERRRLLDEERLHLARELHDVLGHHLAAIHVQANAGLELFDAKPQVARERLCAVRDASRSALLDVQAFLDSLREPSATVTDLDRLLAPARAGGVPVRASVAGAVRPLPAHVDLAASRVIQESLTNVLRHAGRPDTDVHLAYGTTALVVRVENTAATDVLADATTGGQGIAGMRARVRDLGGRFAAGPTRGLGWSVVAELPIEGDMS